MNTSISISKETKYVMLTNLLPLLFKYHITQMSTDHTPHVLVRQKDMRKQSTVAHVNLTTAVQVIGNSSIRVRS